MVPRKAMMAHDHPDTRSMMNVRSVVFVAVDQEHTFFSGVIAHRIREGLLMIWQAFDGLLC